MAHIGANPKAAEARHLGVLHLHSGNVSGTVDLTRFTTEVEAYGVNSVGEASFRRLSFLEAVAYVERLGIPAEVLAPLIRIPLDLAASTADASVEQIKRQDFVGSEASNAVHAAALASVSDAFASVGIEHRLTDAVVSYFDAAARLGLADLEVSALLRVISPTGAGPRR